MGIFVASVLAAFTVLSAAELDEGKAPTLPDPLVMNDGTPVASPEQWQRRRAEIIDLLLAYEYGHMPPPPDGVRSEDETVEPIEGTGVELHRATLLLGPTGEVRLRVGLYFPAGRPGPFPVVLAVEPVWEEHFQLVARMIVEAGYIFAGFERHDLDRDDADRSDGLHPLYPDYDWASLAVWAWGAMRVVDYLEEVDAADANRIVLTGHSRAGKVALLAGALDTRIALTVPHASGAGGAGSYRIAGDGVETLGAITAPDRFHYWFHPKLAEFAGKEDQLPFDQHFLRALVAPRAIASIDGREDLWANPEGTRAMCLAAQPVFEMLGVPKNNMACFRPGGHDTTIADWKVLLAVADSLFFQKPFHRRR